MNNLKFLPILPLLIMDGSYQLIHTLLTNPERQKYLDSPSLQYYIKPYKKQNRKYFNKLFVDQTDEIYTLLDDFEDFVSPKILKFYNEIFRILDINFDDISKEDKIVLATFHCNAVLLKCAKNCQIKINKKRCSQLSDLIELNSQILKKLPIISQNSIDLNKYPSINLSLQLLTNQFFQFFKN